MRLHILSDLHLEFGPAEVPTPEADVVVLAGDVHVGYEALAWAQDHFAGRPVVYVLGNHEFYHHALPGLTEGLKRETEGSHIHLLENSAVELCGFTFLGCTLWTDFLLLNDLRMATGVAEDIMSDYIVIRYGPENRKLRARDTAKLHAESRAWL